MKQKKSPLPWATGKRSASTPKEGVSPPPFSSPILGDDPLSALTRIATPIAETQALRETFGEPIYDRTYQSRFFFRINPSIAEHIRLLRAQEQLSKPSPSEPLNEHIEKRSKEFKQGIAPSLAKRIDKVREYFLEELSPLTMAAQAGSDQAKEVLQVALDSEVEPAVLQHFETMMRYGVQIKMARFIAKYLNLKEDDARVLLEKLGARGKGNSPNNQYTALMDALKDTMSAPPEHPAGNVPGKPSRMERIRNGYKRDIPSADE